jgi:hypothetical protein
MASNQVPRKREQLYTAAEDLADGLKAQEARLSIKQNTEREVRAAFEAAVSANTQFNALSATYAALLEARKLAADDARKFIQIAKGVLAVFLGRRWSPSWLPVGFHRPIA